MAVPTLDAVRTSKPFLRSHVDSMVLKVRSSSTISSDMLAKSDLFISKKASFFC